MMASISASLGVGAVAGANAGEGGMSAPARAKPLEGKLPTGHFYLFATLDFGHVDSMTAFR